MSKKKRRVTTVTAPKDVSPSSDSTSNKPAVAPEGPLITAVAEPATPLLAEVQSFLSRRDELARKLADEIAATEAKLEELRRTAAAFFPENAKAAGPTKDKKPKKLVKAKPLPSKANQAAPVATVAEIVAEPAADGGSTE